MHVQRRFLPLSLAAAPPDAFAASNAVPQIVNTFTVSLLLQVVTALPNENITITITRITILWILVQSQ